MMRWTYLIPRLIIVGLIALALWVGSDPLIRFAVVHNLQNRTGAKVELGQFRCSVENQKIFLKDVAIADARDPMKNLIQAEMAYVELSRDRLLHREVLIERGQASGIRFGATRTENGTLEGFPKPEKKTEFEWKPKTFEPVEDIGIRWVDRLPLDDGDALILNQLELVQSIESMDQFWREQLAAQAIEVSQIRKSTAELGSLVASDLKNPLRPHIVQAESKLDEIALRSRTVQNRLQELQRIATKQRAALKVAHNRDCQKLRQANRVTSFDSDSVSELLLTKVQEDYVAEVVGWFHWFRSSVPDPATHFQPKQYRGFDVQFAGVEQRPGFLIQAIDLEGEGRFANRHINFAGTARDLTPDPKRHDQPATFELRAQGDEVDQHVIFNCTLDRRGDQEIDELKIICNDLELDGRMLGEPNSLLVTLGPANRIQADIQIRTVDGQLSGELVFRHFNVSLHVDKLHELAGGEDTALQMNQGLATVDTFETRVKLSGTIEDYDFDFESDLGSRFANTVNALLVEKGEIAIARQKQVLDRMLAEQIAKIDGQLLPEIRNLANQLNQESTEIASLRDVIPKPSDRLKKMR